MKAVSASPITAKQTRNTGIDCLKVIAILLVVISHVTQTLCEPSAYVASMDYIVPLENSTTNFSYLVLTLLRHTGMLGNDIAQFLSGLFDFLCRDDDVRCLPLGAAERLVDQNPTVRKGRTLSLCTCTEKD